MKLLKLKNKIFELIRNELHKIFPSFFFKNFAKSQCDNEEANFVLSLSDKGLIDKSFIEFGFQPFEFNSVELVKSGWQGLLVDGSEQNVDVANGIFKKFGYNTEAYKQWVKLDNLNFVKEFYEKNGNKLGVLNVDVDGNDYWFLKRILQNVKPQMIIVEHNASFGLRCISTIYSDEFNRYDHSSTGLYHGASITAFHSFLEKDYDLVKNIWGLNLVFLDRNISRLCCEGLSPEEAFSEHLIRSENRGDTHIQQFKEISHLQFNEVGELRADKNGQTAIN